MSNSRRFNWLTNWPHQWTPYIKYCGWFPLLLYIGANIDSNDAFAQLAHQNYGQINVHARGRTLSPNASNPVNRQPVRRSADRLGRSRVTAARYQESIDTGEMTPPVEVLPSNPIPPAHAGEAMLDGWREGESPLGYGMDSLSHRAAFAGAYCDDCGEAECGCFSHVHAAPLAHEGRLRLYLGVLGFNNALNYAGAGVNPLSGDGSGSFGFQEGLQWSTPLPGLFYGEMGAQLGVRTVQANLAGAEFTTDGRNQLYLTAGVFRRVDYGIQGGLVIDYMAERWYLNTDIVQLRGELSYMFNPQHELGFRFSSGMQSTSDNGLILNDTGTLISTSGTFTALDQYRLFTRHALDCNSGSYLEFSAGWTDEKHGILGAMIETRITSQINLQSSFSMGIPGDSVSSDDHQQENWQLGLMFVWTPYLACRSAGLQDYYRPLFEVADPSSFWIQRTK